MSRLLLDTQALLWFILDDPSLSARAKLLMEDPANDLDVSPASFWEIAIKISLGKYHLPAPFESFFANQLAINQMTILPIQVRHAAVVAGLPFHHKDPFDRMLVAQAIIEGIPIISSDGLLDACQITRLW